MPLIHPEAERAAAIAATAIRAWDEVPPFRRALVVANPIAGRGRGHKVGREVVAGLERRGVEAELHLTTARGCGRARVRCLDTGCDLVVSVGGDGTLREVFDGLCDSDVPVGMVPLGTANVLGLDLGLPRDVDRALEVMVARKLARIDVASVNGHLSFLVTGVGIDGMAVREVELRRTGPITKAAYVTALARALRGYRAPSLHVELDGHPLDGEYGLVLVSNVVHYGGVFRLSADCRLDDGLFEVYLFRDASRTALAGVALRGLLARLPGGAGEMRRARRVRVESDRPVAYQVDGDFRGETPVEVEVAGRQYRMLVP